MVRLAAEDPGYPAALPKPLDTFGGRLCSLQCTVRRIATDRPAAVPEGGASRRVGLPFGIGFERLIERTSCFWSIKWSKSVSSRNRAGVSSMCGWLSAFWK